MSSFKIEGRLKNASYVKNVVRDYDIALNELVARYPERYRRASFGRVSGGFIPDTEKTFNRGYTQLWLDGKRGRWSSMDAPKSMGEAIGTVAVLKRTDGRTMRFSVIPSKKGLELHNGDGFSFATADGVTGFRGDVCSGLNVICKDIPDLREGMTLFRNINSAFEKALETQSCRREIRVGLQVRVLDGFALAVKAVTEDGREIEREFPFKADCAENRERADAMIREQLSKRSDIYSFAVERLDIETENGGLPLLSASAINGIRRQIAEEANGIEVRAIRLTTGHKARNAVRDLSNENTLMRSKYCIRHELGMCPVHQGAKATGPLFIVNNGRRFKLGFDCRNCEMTVTSD